MNEAFLRRTLVLPEYISAKNYKPQTVNYKLPFSLHPFINSFLLSNDREGTS